MLTAMHGLYERVLGHPDDVLANSLFAQMIAIKKQKTASMSGDGGAKGNENT